MHQMTGYEYGTLAFSVDMYRFTCEGNGYGQDFTDNLLLFRVLNELAKSRWEPYLHFVDNGEPAWIMRRLKESERLQEGR